MLPVASRAVGVCLLGLGLLCVTGVTTAEAGPRMSRASRSVRNASGACDPHTTTFRTLRRQFSSLGPVARGAKRTRTLLLDPTPRVKRSSHQPLPSTEEAIQNDAPAAQLQDGESQDPVLRRLGLLGSPFDRLPPATRFSPRSPRGPPTTI